MKKSIKITLAVLTVATALVIVVPLGISRFSDKEETHNFARGTIRSYEDAERVSDDNSNGVSLGDYNVKIDHQVNFPDDAVPVDVIEEDEETGALTVTNEDGDVEVINDKALEEAQKTETKANEILDSVLNDVIPQEDKDSSTEAVKEVKKEKEVEQVKKDNTKKEQKDTSDEIDQETKDLFADLGWGEPTTDHSAGNIPEDAVWDIQNPDKNYNGTFTTP
ncbi:MAG: hypothetical protein K0S47_2410 [Herbinix sp.]|jgi:hypothetical protein|nr:hypothetical protein [Herbinix sp.]